LSDYIHPSQQAFTEGRHIRNNIIVAQEITHSFSLSSWKDKAFMLKIDLAKAFARLEWNFIIAALARKGLHDHFINLIHTCVSSPTFLVVINGNPFAKFRGDRSKTRVSLVPAILIRPCDKSTIYCPAESHV
jgi:hypothetical protein